jgi:hypothetical protein
MKCLLQRPNLDDDALSCGQVMGATISMMPIPRPREKRRS